jgi:hypothetical protein
MQNDMLKEIGCTDVQTAMMAIAIKIIIEQKRIYVTFESTEAKPQKTAIQL